MWRKCFFFFFWTDRLKMYSHSKGGGVDGDIIVCCIQQQMNINTKINSRFRRSPSTAIYATRARAPRKKPGDFFFIC
ncbi:hypothetical protein DAPPUDRAFT_304507 [Daphnia pulex]|uniref:Uncharacterized protein n=1 Tax=Daphnia pulex TaxID=6669 RepID=E9GLU9_DAPPU|nr:hypothetical protein DAPPUDRAFT_304507 [Daphnia pulex]|eukprot:EFX79571.1 hypothetical protein DAPPUDRAFT_304507 [Daphnia pulex]